MLQDRCPPLLAFIEVCARLRQQIMKGGRHLQLWMSWEWRVWECADLPLRARFRHVCCAALQRGLSFRRGRCASRTV